MAFSDIYRKQVTLLVRTLPYVSQEECFALKGGTAINLFVRNLPRLSVDIDLTFLPISDWNKSLVEIDSAFKRVAQKIMGFDQTVHITLSAPKGQRAINKLVVRTKERVQIKIEVTPVLRGSVFNPSVIPIAEDAENEFGYAEMNVLSFADLYAGKIMAALDRQHPRDLFDVHLLLQHEGIPDDLRTALIVYLVSHDHSPHSILRPVLKDIEHEYQHNFVGMTHEEVTLQTLLDTRERLIRNVVGNMPDAHKEFLISFYLRKPRWNLLRIDGAENLPAVRWREMNLDKAGKETRNELVRKLEEVIST